MILQIVTTAVDEDEGSAQTYEVELAEGELAQIKALSQPGAWDDVTVTFRGEVYEYPQDVHDILGVIGREITPDHTISVYEY